MRFRRVPAKDGPRSSERTAMPNDATPTKRQRQRRRDTPPPSTGASEREVLVGFLDYLRTSLAAKVAGITEAQARLSPVPSGTNLVGLIQHMAYVERFTFLGEDAASWPATFHVDDDVTVAEVVADYRVAVGQADDVIAGADLDASTVRSRARSKPPSMRWALVHMIEETGRHAGHADIVRELIDGRTGR